MRIVHLCRRFYPDQGGVETHVLQIAKELRKRGHSQSVITSSNESDGVHDDISVYRIPIPASDNSVYYKFSVWRGIWKHFHLLKQADVIQVHDVFWWLLPFLLLLNRSKIFTTFHGYEPPGPPTKIQKFWHMFANYFSHRTLGIGSIHDGWYGVRTDENSFGAVDTAIFSRSAIRRDTKGRIMFLGRLSADIGIMQYLKAILLKPMPMDVYGDGDQMQRAKEFVSQNHLPVTFMGSVPNAARLIIRYDAVFASSYLAIIEALSVGRPIISFYDSALKRDYLLQSPFSKWIVAAKTPKEIVRALTVMKSPPKEAIVWARQQTWSNLASTYERLWA